MCFTSGTSFVGGAVAIDNGGKISYVNNKLLVDTGALLPSSIAISETFFFQTMGGGNSSQIRPSELRIASGALVNSKIETLGQVDVKIKINNISLLFSGQAVIMKNLSLPVILGINFLKYNSLSPILEPYTATLVHTPMRQAQVLIANITTGKVQNNIYPSRSRPFGRSKQSNHQDLNLDLLLKSLKLLLTELLSSWFDPQTM